MKKATTVLCFLCVLTIFNIHSAYSHQSPAQSGAQLPNPLLVLYNAAKTGDSGKYFAAGIELQAREKEYLESPEAAGYIQNIAMYHSIIGEYHQALSGFDHLRPPNTSQPSSNQQSSPLDGYTPQNAFQVIESTADIRQVIFINEAHHVPRHRAFTLQLLKVLYQKGFRYFAAETLSDADAELGRRGYPLFGKTGIYTNEPVYGDLVRTALKLGYTVVPYEENSPCSPDEKDPDSCIKKRERGQAQHLYDRILAKDSKAKILVHAGYSHINKGGFGRGLLSMAQNFKEISGIEPFSIDQVQMMEHSSPDYEKPVYGQAIQPGRVTEPTIFQSKDGKLFVEEKHRSNYDAQIFHPRSKTKSGRPDWLLMGGLRKPYKFPKDLCHNTFPCLVQALLPDEGNGAVPVDQVTISSGKQIPALVLPPGPFLIRAVDQSGKVIASRQVMVN
ncbi:MAG TPA: hypothetical protein PL157_14270 [Acidobacteriota bacterium]|nr:hypothetical protein [Acidobacteriota bacterium]HNH83532.1 hypothetical protein [Acidobacteriota bacterium]